MNIKCHILKLLVLPKSATFLFAVLLVTSFANAQNVTVLQGAFPPGLNFAAEVFPPGLNFAAEVFPPGL